jgi:hypothetical protein
MARGLPDYYNPSTVVSQRLVDMSEVMAALAGLTTMDGRGHISFFETFKEGMGAWALEKTGNGEYPIASSVQAEVSPVSCYMNTPHGQPANRSGMYIYRILPGQYRIGVEYSVYLTTITASLLVTLYIEYGGNYYDAVLTLTPSTSTLKIQGKTTSSRTFDLGDTPSYSAWIPIKLVIDASTGYAVRLLIGSTEYDVSDIELDTGAITGAGVTYLHIDARQSGAVDWETYVGHVILTSDEP